MGGGGLGSRRVAVEASLHGREGEEEGDDEHSHQDNDGRGYQPVGVALPLTPGYDLLSSLHAVGLRHMRVGPDVCALCPVFANIMIK